MTKIDLYLIMQDRYPPMRKIPLAITLAAILAALLTACGCSDGTGKPGGGSRGAATVPVEALVVRPQPLANKIFTTGTLLANEEVELRSEISGRITNVYFQEGSRVTSGQLMLKVNDAELRAQLRRKELEEKLAADEELRKRNLFEIKVISQEEYDQALNRYKMIQAEREVIESQLAKTEIRAPFDGRVGLRYVSEGGYVSPNMLAATMQDLDPVKVEFAIPEKYAGLLRDGAKVLVRVGDLDSTFDGTVYAIESKIDQGTRTIKARARIPNPREILIPGAFARVELTLEEIPNAIVVPTETVIPELNGEKVFVSDNGVARAVRVTTGIRTEKSIQITAGLKAEDTLIVTGLLQLGEGKGVQIKQLRDN